MNIYQNIKNKLYPHHHLWVQDGLAVKSSDSLNPKHWGLPDVVRFKCECGKTMVKRGTFEYILP